MQLEEIPMMVTFSFNGAVTEDLIETVYSKLFNQRRENPNGCTARVGTPFLGTLLIGTQFIGTPFIGTPFIGPIHMNPIHRNPIHRPHSLSRTSLPTMQQCNGFISKATRSECFQ